MVSLITWPANHYADDADMPPWQRGSEKSDGSSPTWHTKIFNQNILERPGSLPTRRLRRCMGILRFAGNKQEEAKDQ
jgi:hypothetical protein